MLIYLFLLISVNRQFNMGINNIDINKTSDFSHA